MKRAVIWVIRGLNRKNLNFARYLAPDSTQYITGGRLPRLGIARQTRSMKKKSASQSGFFNLRFVICLFAVLASVFLALLATSAQIRRPERALDAMSPWAGVQEEWVARYHNEGNTAVGYQTLSNNTP